MDIKDLKQRKKDLKLTVAQLAVLAELPVGTVSKIMTGETKNPSYITIEKLDAVLLREERRVRVEAYIIALTKYVREHPDDDVDQVEFEKQYRKEHNLSNDPIPFAVPVSGNVSHGNLAPVGNAFDSLKEIRAIEDNKLVELLNGHLIYNEAPGMRHQTIVRRLGWLINKFIDDNHGECLAFDMGINVIFDEDDPTLLIPDIAVICDPDTIKEDAVYGAPDWIIEVVSKSTRSRDYGDKMHKYMSCGVREYWIVDPDKDRVTTYIQGEPMMAYIYSVDDDIPVVIYDGKLMIRVNE